MGRRELLGVLGATAAGLAAVTGGSALAQDARVHMVKSMGGHKDAR